MQQIMGTTQVPNWKITTRRLWLKFKVFMVIALILEGIALWNNPVLLMKQAKAFNRHMEMRARKIKYELIREQRGSTIAEMSMCGDVWRDFGKSMNKAWRDTASLFNGGK